MQAVTIRRVCVAVWLSLFLALATASAADPDGDDDTPEEPGRGIIGKFIQATQGHEDLLRGCSMQVDIDASIPKLKERGTLRALRKISNLGVITYHVLAFQGDNTVKNEVIARYLQAEQQGQGDQALAITPANYKFKGRGQRQTDVGQVYVFQLTPRKNKVGLFKGEIWLDSKTYLPVLEKGRLVKNPSIWFRKVEFQRDFAVRNGVAVPKHMSSTIDVRLFGKVQLNIAYSDYERNADATEVPAPQSMLETAIAL